MENFPRDVGLPKIITRSSDHVHCFPRHAFLSSLLDRLSQRAPSPQKKGFVFSMRYVLAILAFGHIYVNVQRFL